MNQLRLLNISEFHISIPHPAPAPPLATRIEHKTKERKREENERIYRFKYRTIKCWISFNAFCFACGWRAVFLPPRLIHRRRAPSGWKWAIKRFYRISWKNNHNFEWMSKWRVSGMKRNGKLFVCVLISSFARRFPVAVAAQVVNGVSDGREAETEERNTSFSTDVTSVKADNALRHAKSSPT